jgi:glycosyltransferase involved in cell wall biosynthesis
MENKNTKVLWISDFNLNHTLGGAQRSNDLIIKKGRELGLSIMEANYNFNFKIFDFNEYDIIVSSNLETIAAKHEDIINKIASHKYHVRLEHDLNRYLNQTDREKLFRSCKKTIFLTDYHHKLFISNYGDFFQNVEIVADPIDTDLFYNKNNQREDKILYVGFMHDLKGTSSFFEFALANTELEFVVAGWGSRIYTFLSENVSNVKYLGPVQYEKMPELYNKYDKLFYNPVLPEPFCRSVGEAVLCGMKLMSNSSSIIGCMQEIKLNGQEKMRENCKNATVNFWNKVLP